MFALPVVEPCLRLGLDKLCFFSGPLFFLLFSKNQLIIPVWSTYYSIIIQHTDTKFLIKTSLTVFRFTVATQKEKYSPVVLTFGLEKEFFRREKTCLASA